MNNIILSIYNNINIQNFLKIRTNFEYKLAVIKMTILSQYGSCTGTNEFGTHQGSLGIIFIILNIAKHIGNNYII